MPRKGRGWPWGAWWSFQCSANLSVPFPLSSCCPCSALCPCPLPALLLLAEVCELFAQSFLSPVVLREPPGPVTKGLLTGRAGGLRPGVCEGPSCPRRTPGWGRLCTGMVLVGRRKRTGHCEAPQ